MYHNVFAYDANGNITKQLRKNESGADIDSLSYKYQLDGNGKLIRNRLYHVNDNVSPGTYGDDIDDQGTLGAGVDNNTGVREIIYDEGPGSGWTAVTSAPAGGTVNTSSATGPKIGSLCATYDGIPGNGYRGFERGTSLDVSGYSYLTFFIRNRKAVDASNTVRVYVTLNATSYGNVSLLSYGYSRTLLNEWQQISIPLSDFSISGNVDRVWVRPNNATPDTYDYDLDYLIFTNDENPNVDVNTNYVYDAEGRLIRDRQEEIENIQWRVDGKVLKIERPDTSSKKNLIFEYDAMGQRVAKHVLSSSDELEKSTYYVLDAQGNVMSVYERVVDEMAESIAFYQAEKHIYGSSRIGIMNDSISLLGSENEDYDMTVTDHVIGLRHYELTNHLGNVLSTITDCPIPIEEDEYCLTLDGTNDYASTSLLASSVTDEVTLGAWVRTSGSASNQLIASHYSGGTDKGFQLAIKAADGKAYIDGRNGNGTYYSTGGTTVVTDGEWHYISGTVDGATWKIYVDGVLENTGTFPLGTFSGIGRVFQIGASTPSAVYFKGDIKEVSYWDYARSASDIQSDMNTILSGSEPGLVGYWPLTDNSDPTVDLGPGSYTATFQNGATLDSEPIVRYLAKIVTAQDYSPFGVTLPGRNFTLAGAEKSRFSFQGQEHDDEIKGEGNSINYTYRMHDPRLGRFFAVDPLATKYSYNSPYTFSENRLIDANELEGAERRAPVLYRQNSGRMVRTVVGYSSYSTETRLYRMTTSRGPVPQTEIKIEEHPVETMGKILDDLGDLKDLIDQKYTLTVNDLKGGATVMQSVHNSLGHSYGYVDKTELQFTNPEDEAKIQALEDEYWTIVNRKTQELLTAQGYGGGECIPCQQESKELYKDKIKPEAPEDVKNRAKIAVTMLVGPSPKESLKGNILNSPSKETSEQTIEIQVMYNN